MKPRIDICTTIFFTVLLSSFGLAWPFTATATGINLSTGTPIAISTPQLDGQQTFQIFLPIVEKGKDIVVANPGNYQNIQPLLQAAINGAAAGYTIILPAGEFYIDGSVYINRFISLVGQGSGPGGTKLYRRESISDATLSSNYWRYMVDFQCDSSASSGIRISGIHFQSKIPSEVPGDGKSQAEDYGLRLRKCVDFVVEDNKFEYFGNAGVLVAHQDNLARGVIAKNVFNHNWRYKPGAGAERNFTKGYGVVVSGEDSTWVSDPKFGSNNFIFIEDNYFFSHRHSIAAGGTGLYVFRYNEVRNNFEHAIDAHGGGLYGNIHSARAYEVYGNTVINDIFLDSNGLPISNLPIGNPCASLVYIGLRFRGGEGLVYGNTIQGFEYGIGLEVEVSGTYPVFTQIGYQDGDVYLWANQFTSYSSGCGGAIRNSNPDLIAENRDYYQGIVKPGYAAYQYPHPLR